MNGLHGAGSGTSCIALGLPANLMYWFVVSARDTALEGHSLGLQQKQVLTQSTRLGELGEHESCR